MSGKANSIFEAAKTLSREERADVAGRLLETLEEDDEKADRAEIDAAWIAECNRRSEAYRNGEMKSVPIEEILDMVKTRTNS
jgi:putative addiction module component (TIGR02574 family)